MKLEYPAQVKIWIWRCGTCGRSIMAPEMNEDFCKAYCPVCSSYDIIPDKILIWLSAQPNSLKDVWDFLRYRHMNRGEQQTL